jgi:DNA-binding MarR family transcriptional regulator
MEAADDAAMLSVHVLEQLVRVLRPLGTDGGLSSSAAATLNRLCSDGPFRLTELSAAEGMSQPGMTQLVNRLGREGLVRRRASSHDGRVVMVEATTAGRSLAERRRAQRTEAVADLLGQLEDDDRAAIHHALPALARLAALAAKTRTRHRTAASTDRP